MSTVTIEIAGDVPEDKFDIWLEVRTLLMLLELLLFRVYYGRKC